MGRRNVLGNQIEPSKSMWIVLLGFLVSIAQFAIYHFINDGWLGVLLGAGCVLLGSIVVHRMTGEQEEILSYLLIPCIVSGGLGLLMPQMSTELLPSSEITFLSCLLAWLIPVLYACIVTWLEGNIAMSQFSAFYKKASLFFYLIYFCVMIYQIVWKDRGVPEAGSMQLIPFATLATYVDGLNTELISMEQILEFLAGRVVLFLPYGFFVAMVGREFYRLLRLWLVLLLPMVTEILQGVFGWGSCDVDDAILSFLGGLLGMLCFAIFNGLFHQSSGKHFDGSEVERDYYGRKI